MKNMQVAGQKVRIDSDTGYICITDISKLKGQPSALIPAWLRTRTTIKFIAAWETKYNPDFNTLEFEGIKNQAGDNTFFIYAKDLIGIGCKGRVLNLLGRVRDGLRNGFCFFSQAMQYAVAVVTGVLEVPLSDVALMYGAQASTHKVWID